jgi:hypothetical protein
MISGCACRSRVARLTSFSCLLSDPMSRCALPFFPNKSNYVSDDEHDGNPRKLWYLVLGEGLFTKKCVFSVFSLPAVSLRLDGILFIQN